MTINTSFFNLDSKIENLINNDPKLGSMREKLLRKWRDLRKQKLNIMITGATGCGKSSTINALFNMDAATETQDIAKVGVGSNPETMDIVKYELGNMILWDSPGLGDGKEADPRHSHNIIDKLLEKNGNEYVIDLVLVILDGGSRDLGTSYQLINDVIIPNLGEEKSKRILVAINQADNAMKGRFWDHENCRPEQKLADFLEEKCQSVRRRIKEGTGVDVEPIYYSAGFKEEGLPQEKPYNLAKLLYFILKHIPAKKRIFVMEGVTTEKGNLKSNQDSGIKTSIRKTIKDGIGEIFDGIGEAVSAVTSAVVETVGSVISSVCDSVCSFFSSWF